MRVIVNTFLIVVTVLVTLALCSCLSGLLAFGSCAGLLWGGAETVSRTAEMAREPPSLEPTVAAEAPEQAPEEGAAAPEPIRIEAVSAAAMDAGRYKVEAAIANQSEAAVTWLDVTCTVLDGAGNDIGHARNLVVTSALPLPAGATTRYPFVVECDAETARSVRFEIESSVPEIPPPADPPPAPPPTATVETPPAPTPARPEPPKRDAWEEAKREARDYAESGVGAAPVTYDLVNWRIIDPSMISVKLKITNQSHFRRIRSMEATCIVEDAAGNEIGFARHYAIKSVDGGLAPGRSTYFDYIIDCDAHAVASASLRVEHWE